LTAAAGGGAQARDELDVVLEQAVAAGVFPGAVVAWGQGERTWLRACGRLTYAGDSAPVKPDTLYDLASLTKVVGTTLLALRLVEDGRLDLDAPVVEHVPEFQAAGRAHVSARHLLAHAAGLPASRPYYLEARDPRDWLARLWREPLEAAPGTRACYSDLGFVLLGVLIERVGGLGLRDAWRTRVQAPLGLHATDYLPAAELHARVAPTEHDPWRGRLLVGEVHDENAAALGGVAAHAGLFGSASDLVRVARFWSTGGLAAHGRLVSAAGLAAFTRPAGLVPGSSRALGWDTP
jgi:CubicO group peptidase (beta-lactamase class C family)